MCQLLSIPQMYWVMVYQLIYKKNFIIRILMLSWPLALFGSSFWINFIISSFEKLNEDRRSIKYWTFKGSVLLLFIKVHWLAKWELKSSSFFSKSVTNALCVELVGWFRFFYYLRNFLKKTSMLLNFFEHCLNCWPF